MGLTQALDFKMLESWSLLKDYANNKEALIAVGKAVYQTFRIHGGEPPPNPVDLERSFVVSLNVTSVFKGICERKRHAIPELHPVFAQGLARYILDHEWQAITST
jgi:hypothetical protein